MLLNKYHVQLRGEDQGQARDASRPRSRLRGLHVRESISLVWRILYLLLYFACTFLKPPFLLVTSHLNDKPPMGVWPEGEFDRGLAFGRLPWATGEWATHFGQLDDRSRNRNNCTTTVENWKCERLTILC